MGYLDNEKANKELFDEEGWIHTGDLGSVDEAGSISIQDRIKELIKVRVHPHRSHLLLIRFIAFRSKDLVLRLRRSKISCLATHTTKM